MTSLQREMLSIKSEILELKELIIKRNPDQKELLSADETMVLLGIKRTTFDELRKEGYIRSYKIRRKIFCKYSEIMETINSGLLEVSPTKAG